MYIVAYDPALSWCRLRDVGGKSLETLEALSNDKATMETQLSMQVSRRQLCTCCTLLALLTHNHSVKPYDTIRVQRAALCPA